MLKDQCISVTDLRTKTKECMEGLQKEPKYIFINNKPIAVLIDIVEYEYIFTKPKLVELTEEEASSPIREEASRAKKTKKSDLINI